MSDRIHKSFPSRWNNGAKPPWEILLFQVVAVG
jgi:hypothetical protein